MTAIIDRVSTREDIVAIAERASLYEWLRNTFRRDHSPQELPHRLYADLGLPPSEHPDFGPRMR